jgi:hypothetical protein
MIQANRRITGAAGAARGRARWQGLCGWLLVLGLAAARAEPPAAALVTGLDGAARRLAPAGAQHLEVLDALAAEEVVQLAPGTRAELVLLGGPQRVVELQGPGRVRIGATALQPLDAGLRLRERDLLGDWRTLRLRPGLVGRASVSLRGPLDAPLLLRGPVGAQRPATAAQLRWETPWPGPPAHWAYRVAVLDEDGQQVLAADAPLTSLAAPAPWQRGRHYLWTVSARTEEGRRVERSAEFVVVGPEVEQRIDALEQAAAAARARWPDAPACAEDVLFALALEQDSLRDEADARWRDLARARPAYAPWGGLGR